MELGDFIRATNCRNGYFVIGELVGYDDDGHIFIFKDDKEYFLHSSHYRIEKLSSLEIELL